MRAYLEAPGDGRPLIPARALLRHLLMGQLLRETSFHGLDALTGRSSVRRAFGMTRRFSDDALAYFTAGWGPAPTRTARLEILRRAQRGTAFDNSPGCAIYVLGTIIREAPPISASRSPGTARNLSLENSAPLLDPRILPPSPLSTHFFHSPHLQLPRRLPSRPPGQATPPNR